MTCALKMESLFQEPAIVRCFGVSGNNVPFRRKFSQSISKDSSSPETSTLTSARVGDKTAIVKSTTESDASYELDYDDDVIRKTIFGTTNPCKSGYQYIKKSSRCRKLRG